MIGRRLSHYEVFEALGAGGMGVVYRAHDTRLDRDVAIKVLPADRPRSPRARLRFKREATAASHLNHPNIITIYEIGAEGGTEYIVMEYVRGVTLASLLKSRRLTLEEAFQYAVQVADALGKAHAAGVIHRDIKPGNIMINDEGLVKVLDFGLAKLKPTGDDGETPDPEGTKDMTLTQPGMVTGTVFYMSPEQARGDKVDARSDIFSFGSVLFEMVTGKLPFTGANSVAVLHNLHFSPPHDLRELQPDLPEALVALLNEMLEKDVDKRVQTMGEVSRRLRQCAGYSQGPATWQRTAWSAETVEREATPVRRQKWISRAVLAAGLLLVLAGTAWWIYPRIVRPTKVTGIAPEAPLDDTAYAHYSRAREYLDHYDREGNVDRAITHLQRALQLDTKSAASYAALAEAYFLKNKSNPDPQWMTQASDSAHRAVQLDSYLAAAHNSIGLVEMEVGRNAEAEKQFRAAADLDPKNAASFLWLGSLYDRTGKRDQAKLQLDRARELDPNDWRIYLALGAQAYDAADYQGAVTYCQQALSHEPDSVDVLQNLSAAYTQLERDDDAAAVLQKALAIKPTADIYNNLGTIRFYQGHYDEAVPAFEKTVELGANNFDNWASLGDAYRWSSNQKDKANAAYANAIRLVREQIEKHPDQPKLHADLAMYLAKSGDKAGALDELKLAQPARGNQPDLLYVSATAYELCGERDKALDALARGVKAGLSLADVKKDPELISLRADPRYHLNVVGSK